MVGTSRNKRRKVREMRANVLASYQKQNESGGMIMEFIFRIQNHYFKKGTPWVELDKIKQRSWFLSIDIEDDEAVPCYDTVHELRISKGTAFKSVKILTGKTQEAHPYWEALLDMSYSNSTELRDVTFKDLPGESGIYMLNIWFDYDGEDLNFGNDFKKLCEHRHKWDDGWVCSRCGVRKADWAEADIKWGNNHV
jgi:hypothetical protein